MSALFDGLLASDFDAYLPARASSNAFVRPRVAVKEKLVALAQTLAHSAPGAGLGLEVSASDERPSLWNKKSVTEQWAFLWRDREAREGLERSPGYERPLGETLADPRPWRRHAFVGLRLDAESFAVTLRVHRDAWADVRTLLGRLEAEGEALAHAVRAAGEGFVLGVEGGTQMAATQADPSLVRGLLDEALERGAWWTVGKSWSRDEALAAAGGLGAQALGAGEALLALYRLAAWRPESDVASVAHELARHRDERERERAARDAREREREETAQREGERRRAQAESDTRARVASLARVRPAVLSAAVVKLESEPVRERKPEPKAPPKNVRESAPPLPPPETRVPSGWRAAGEPVVLGARVRVTRGALRGKEGTVLELDPRGNARVQLGALSARVAAGELETLSAVYE